MRAPRTAAGDSGASGRGLRARGESMTDFMARSLIFKIIRPAPAQRAGRDADGEVADADCGAGRAARPGDPGTRDVRRGAAGRGSAAAGCCETSAW